MRYASNLPLPVLAQMLCVGVLACSPEQEAGRSGVSAIEDSLMTAAKARNPGWRFAADSDFTGTAPSEESRTERMSFTPYIARDGTGRFAFAMVRDTVFKVFVAQTGSQATPRVDEWATAWWLRRGRVSWRGDTLVLAPPSSGALVEIVWDARIGRPRMLPEDGD